MAYTFKHGDRPLDDFTIQRAVGAGGFGEVYYAISDGGREVALKYLRDNPQIELRGVSHCINLKSPHLVSIFDVKKNADGDYFIIMEYCSGPSLRDLLIAEPKGFGPEKSAFFVREIAKGLSYLHDRGIVHRDLKPGNICYDDGYVKIGDYGLSKFIAVSRHSAQTASVGTVHYMAPEIGSGEYSRGIDIYALGVMLYEMLMGKVPFEGSSMGEVLMKHLTAQPAVDQLPHPFGNVIRRALQKDPKDRYQNVNEMVDELLTVESVQKSLAGFSTKSLEGAVRRGGTETIHSPVPSPNPPPFQPRGFRPSPASDSVQGDRPGDWPSPFPLPDRIARKMERISRKIDRKMARLTGRKGRGSPRDHRSKPARYAANEGDVARPQRDIPIHDRRKRVVLSALLTVGLSVGMGVFVGNAVSADIGAAAWMMTMAMPGMVVLSRRVISWFGAEAGPTWTQRLLRAVIAAGPMAVAAAPALTSPHYHDPGLAVYLGLLIVVTLGRCWDRIFLDGEHGELRLGRAIGAGVFAVFATMLIGLPLDIEPDSHVPVAGLIALAASLIVQSTAWWIRPYSQRSERPRPWWEKHDGTSEPGGREFARQAVGPQGQAYASQAMAAPPLPHPDAVPWTGQPGTVPGQPKSGVDQPVGPPMRWGITRAFWGILAFVLMSGAIVTAMIPFVQPELSSGETSRQEATSYIVACMASLAATWFCMRKTTPYKRGSFVDETLRPGLRSVMLFVVASSLTIMISHWEWVNDNGLFGVGVGVVSTLSVLMFIPFPRSRRRRNHQDKQQPFLQPTGATDSDQVRDAAVDAAGPASDAQGDAPIAQDDAPAAPPNPPGERSI